MKWFLTSNDGSPIFPAYMDMVKVAVHTARRHTRLEPYLLYDGQENAFCDWLRRHGVTVVPRRWRLLDEYRRVAVETGNPQLLGSAAGVFLRTEIPRYCAEQGWEDEEILYTDCDVMFAGDPEPLWPDLHGAFFGAAPEIDPKDVGTMNSGVLLMRVAALMTMDHAFQEFMRKHMAECARETDQFAYQIFFRRGWKLLPAALNWKPYWGLNPDARIVHFHGPKPFVRPAISDGTAAPIQRELARGAFAHYCELWDAALAEAG